MSDSFSDVINYLRGFPSKMEREVEDATKKNVALAERTAVMHLKNQDLSWKSLSPAYAERKALTGSGRRSYFRGTKRGRQVKGRRRGRRLSEKTLIATATMMRNITSEVNSFLMGAAGVKRAAKYAGGGRIANVAAVHEFGSRDGRIPKRPLWEPTANEIRDECAKNWLRAIDRTIKRG